MMPEQQPTTRRAWDTFERCTTGEGSPMSAIIWVTSHSTSISTPRRLRLSKKDCNCIVRLAICGASPTVLSVWLERLEHKRNRSLQHGYLVQWTCSTPPALR